MKTISTCSFCGCGCGIIIESENDHVISVSPQKNHPVSRGTLCIKGWNGHQIVHHPDRLTTPLIKDKDGFKKASWDTAFDFILNSIQDIQKNNGSDSVGVIGSLHCTNEELYLLNKLTRTILKTNNIDTAARLYMAPMYNCFKNAYNWAGATTDITDIEQTDAVLVIGANPKVQNANVGSYILQAAKSGKRTILIDSHEQELSRFFTVYLQSKPSYELYILNTLIHIILEKDLYDPYCEQIKTLQPLVAEFTPELCTEKTGVPTEMLYRTAELFATAPRATILFGTGITQQAKSVALINAIINLAIITGNINKKGAGILPLHYANNLQGAIDMGAASDLLPGHHSFSSEGIGNNGWQNLPAKTGLSFQEMIDSCGEKIKALYVVGENLMWSAPNSNSTGDKLDKLDFLIVQDMFLNETAQKADVVLPACSYTEKEGTVTNLECRVQKIRKAIQPIGDSLSDLDIISKFIQTFTKQAQENKPENIYKEIQQYVPFYQAGYKELDPPGGFLVQERIKPDDIKLIPQIHSEEMEEQVDEEYPFICVVARKSFHRITGTQNIRSFTLKKEYASGTVEINTNDARDLKLRSGWKIKVVTRRGEIIRTVNVTHAVKPGTINVSIHNIDGLTQSLVRSDLEKDAKTPIMKICAAKLENI